MNTKELIEAGIGAMDEKQLNELYPIVKQFAAAKKQAPQSLMSKLRSIKIDAPEDFATNLDLYMSGEKRIGGLNLGSITTTENFDAPLLEK